jgi:radical SAM protein with 4Fe4S-binding SPASM domain
MLFRQKLDTFIRIYDDIGYIINTTDFSDHVTDISGAIFLKALSREPKLLEDVVAEIAKSFTDADIRVIEKDALDFFTTLEQSGFIVSGKTIAELEKKDIRFSYSRLLGNTAMNNPSLLLPGDNDSQTFLENHFKSKPQLMSMQIELTSRCNERCIHCYIPHENKVNDIDPLLFYSVLDQCSEMGVLNITLSGGEAMIHPCFCEFLQKAKTLDFSVTVLSNLTQLNDEIISVMKEGALCSVQVSLYSMNPEIHDFITKLPGSFEKTKSAILKLIENNIPIQISCPMMKQNKNCYKDVLNWAHQNKCKAQTDFIMIARYDRSTDNLDNRLSPEETGDVVMDIINNDIIYRQQILSPEFETMYFRHKDVSDDIVCGVCASTLCMVANGNIYPCAGWQNYVVGNVKESSLKEIWRNSPRVKYLRSLRRKDFPKCLNCKDRVFCSLCMVRNANEAPDGDLFTINEHFCKVAAINHKIALDWKAKQVGGKL